MFKLFFIFFSIFDHTQKKESNHHSHTKQLRFEAERKEEKKTK
jgi:hypothetical protein